MTETESIKEGQETEGAPAPEKVAAAPPANDESASEAVEAAPPADGESASEAVEAAPPAHGEPASEEVEAVPPADGESAPEEPVSDDDEVASGSGSILGAFSRAPGSRRERRRVGRGPGSGRGKTCGRGTKGQKSRSGVAINGFEGGQMPIHMRMPKRGFRNAPFRRTPVPVNLDRIQAAVDAGKLDADAVIDTAALKKAGIVRRAPDGVRVLGRGSLNVALRIEAAGVSASAAAIIEKAGGSFTRVGASSESDGS